MGFIRHNLRAIFYALVMSFGLIFVQQLALTSELHYVILGAMVLGLTLILEIYTTYSTSTKLLRQLDLPSVEIYTQVAQFIYHLLLPLLTYIGFVGFIYTNNQASLSLLYFCLSLIIFTMLFINIRAYYQDKFKLEEQTHVVYDLIKIFLFFTVVDSILNISNQYGFNFFVIVGLVFSVTSILSLLILLRYRNLGYLSMGLVLVSGMVIGYLTAVLVEFLDERILITSFYSTLIFYIFNAILHHDMERTLRFNIILEYLLVAGICFSVILLLP